ncbi:MAG: pyridoxamine kinase [Thermoguttaceae bacterium]|nr:pyridoxamine kinase [Thermoguttaceae bacterium]
MKRILTIQDISCVGKCSLTVALPIVSAAQIETCVLPTAVLSTHTQFQGFTFCDLTKEIAPIEAHWLKERISFDAIYTGYLGSFEQIDLVEKLIDDFKTDDNLIFVDPVMGDAGKLYVGFDQAFADRMASFCSKADVIVPNLTEASFMLHTPYVETGYDEKYIDDLLEQLLGLGAKVAVLTGVSFEKGQLGVVGIDSRTGRKFSYFRDELEGRYHGTGDVFASAALAALIRERSLRDAFAIAADFVAESIQATLDNPESRRYGVDFETALPSFVKNFA